MSDLATLGREHESGVGADLLNIKSQIGPFRVRPMTLEVLTMLQHIKSPLVMGADLSKVDNIFLDIQKMLVLLTVDPDEALELIEDWETGGKELTRRAFALGRETTPQGAREMISQAIMYLKKSMETAVRPDLDSGPGASRDKEKAEAVLTDEGNG